MDFYGIKYNVKIFQFWVKKMVEIIAVKFGDELIKYLDIIEEYLQRYSEEFAKKSKIDFDDPYCDVDEYFLYASEYPNILRKSFLIICYSFLEHELIAECKLKGDLRAGGIDDAVKCLGFDVSSYKPWNEIKNIQKIRNCIVHSDGVLTNCRDREYIRTYIENRSEKDIFIENDEITLSADYCRYMVKIFTEFESKVKSALSLKTNKNP